MFGELSVFAGGFSLAAVAAVCCGGDEAAALDLMDRLASKSLVVAETAAGRTRYRMLETIRQYAAGRLAEAGETEPARRRHAEAFLELAQRERDLAVLAREQDNFRAALEWSLSRREPDGPRLACGAGRILAGPRDAPGGTGLAGACPRGRSVDARLRAELLRLLGAVLYAAGDVDGRRLSWSGAAAGRRGGRAARGSGPDPGPAGGNPRDARRDQRRRARDMRGGRGGAGVRGRPGGPGRGVVSVGKVRFFCGDTSWTPKPSSAPSSTRGKAATTTRSWRSGHGWSHHPGPAHHGRRGDRPGRAAARRRRGDPWAEAAILQQLSLLYGFAGRSPTPARHSRAASPSSPAPGRNRRAHVRDRMAGRIELIAGDPAAAERQLRKERGVPRDGRTRMARHHCRAARRGRLRAGRIGQALQLTNETEALAPADDMDTQGRWRATGQAARPQGQFPAAAAAGRRSHRAAPGRRPAPNAGRVPDGQGRGIPARRRAG